MDQRHLMARQMAAWQLSATLSWNHLLCPNPCHHFLHQPSNPSLPSQPPDICWLPGVKCLLAPLTALHRPAGHWLLSRDQARDRPEALRTPRRSLGGIAQARQSCRPSSASAAHWATTELGPVVLLTSMLFPTERERWFCDCGYSSFQCFT